MTALLICSLSVCHAEEEVQIECNYGSIGYDESEEAIIGADMRGKISNTTITPFRWICSLRAKTNKGYILGSASLVGPNTAITAAHCVYDRKTGSYLKNITLYPGANNGKNPYGSATVTTIYIPKEYKTCENNMTSRYDYAVVKLNKNIGSKTGYFGLKSIDNSKPVYSISVTGYPGDKMVNGQAMMYRGTGKTLSIDKNGVFTHNVDTMGGDSGAPMYISQNGKYYVIGIHASTNGSTKNYGRAITGYICKWIKSKM